AEAFAVRYHGSRREWRDVPNLRGARYDRSTRWPAGVRPGGHGARPRGGRGRTEGEEAPPAPLSLVGVPGLVAFPLRLRASNRARPPAIPRSELAALGTAIKDADQLAADGRVGDGLPCLVAGMRRVQQSQSGYRWSGELVERWQAVVDEYATDHRIGPT